MLLAGCKTLSSPCRPSCRALQPLSAASSKVVFAARHAGQCSNGQQARTGPRSPLHAPSAAAAEDAVGGALAATDGEVQALGLVLEDLRLVVKGRPRRPGSDGNTEVSVPLRSLARYPESAWTQQALRDLRFCRIPPEEAAEYIASEGGRVSWRHGDVTFELTGPSHRNSDLKQELVVVPYPDRPIPTATSRAWCQGAHIAAHIYRHGTLCGAALPPDAELTWLRETVLKPFVLPDPTDLEFVPGLASHLPAGGLEHLMRLHHEAMVERAAASIKAALPTWLLTSDAVCAFAAIPETKAARLAVYRLSEDFRVTPGNRNIRGVRCGSFPEAAAVELELPRYRMLPSLREALAKAVESSLHGLEADWNDNHDCNGRWASRDPHYGANRGGDSPAVSLLLVRIKPELCWVRKADPGTAVVEV
ncbi:hypothetical protein GPECTOR_15g440 [Gonium pectorale]|uniref:Uncharacterized protein n=1 Tax=Gonium pectorale TaxID=33097 RepID=A0A150GLY0_GONPE|nr:hypothetical protein GPECTOR_15g440 [Gonium pectorale]|eukprot:KXZ50755.1 hypothetical protein GPECTOR_15g440 [Gonium pectorale]